MTTSVELTGSMTALEFTKEQLWYLRMMLFQELREGAEALAENANAAGEGSADEDKQAVAELDSWQAYHWRVRITAELLEIVGWGGGD